MPRICPHLPHQAFREPSLSLEKMTPTARSSKYFREEYFWDSAIDQPFNLQPHFAKIAPPQALTNFNYAIEGGKRPNNVMLENSEQKSLS